MTEAPVRVSPITTEIVRNRLVAITDEMKVNLMRTAYNMVIYEALDYTVGLFDAEGNTISIGLGLPMFIRGLSDTIKAKIRHYGSTGIKPGDMLLTNDAYITGNHLNHIVVTKPIDRQDGGVVCRHDLKGSESPAIAQFLNKKTSHRITLQVIAWREDNRTGLRPASSPPHSELGTRPLFAHNGGLRHPPSLAQPAPHPPAESRVIHYLPLARLLRRRAILAALLLAVLIASSVDSASPTTGRDFKYAARWASSSGTALTTRTMPAASAYCCAAALVAVLSSSRSEVLAKLPRPRRRAVTTAPPG